MSTLKSLSVVLTFVMIMLLLIGGIPTQQIKIDGESMVLIGERPAVLWHNKIVPGSIKARSTYLLSPKTVKYEEGIDYIADYHKGVISRTKNSRMPDYGKHPVLGIKKFDHRNFKEFSNAPYFVWVDYKTENPSPFLCSKKKLILPHQSEEKLKKGEPFKMVIFGDSISTGAEVTCLDCTYFSRYTHELTKRFPESKITMVNHSTAGDSTEMALPKIPEKVMACQPDLVIVAFGMNDHNLKGFGGVEPNQFADNLFEIVNSIKTKTHSDVILVSTFPPNPDWYFGTSRMEEYAEATKQIAEKTDSPYADVYSLWMNVLQRKDCYSLINNNINHPNNFGHWLYYQAFFRCPCKRAAIHQKSTKGG